MVESSKELELRKAFENLLSVDPKSLGETLN